MTLADKIAQLLMVRIGSNMPPPKPVEDDAERILALIEEVPIGGLCLFNGSGAETAETLIKLQKKSKYPLLVGTDMERGLGQQVRGCTVFPHLMAFSAMDNPTQKAKDFAMIGGREALKFGVHIAFAPVADVSRNPKNPIIATRAFATNPEMAANLVKAYVEGCQEIGLLSCPKHFPGHGNTDKDSHDSVPSVLNSKEELATFDFPPFLEAIHAGAELVMTAHLVYPALDPSNVSTASAPILTDLLRQEMGFKGCVITDSLLMAGIGGTELTEPELIVKLLNAGVDIMLDVKDPKAIVEGVLVAVAQNQVSEARIDAAFERVQALKSHFIERFGADFFTNPAQYFSDVTLGDSSSQLIADEMAANAIRCVKGNPQLYPISKAEKALVVLIRPFSTPLDPEEQPLGAALREISPNATYVECNEYTTKETFDSLLSQATAFQHVVVAPILKPAAWRKFGLTETQLQFVHALVGQQSVVLASLGSPELFNQLPETDVQVCTYSDMACSQRAFAQTLFATP